MKRRAAGSVVEALLQRPLPLAPHQSAAVMVALRLSSSSDWAAIGHFGFPWSLFCGSLIDACSLDDSDG